MSDAASPPILNDSAALELSRGAFFAGLAALLVFYCLFAFYRLGDVPLLDPDEPRYAAAGRTMARGGSLLVPEFNGAKRINKPPLYYWLVAASMKLTGSESEAAARLPSIVLGLGMLLLTVFLGKRIYGARTGLLAGIILASTALFVGLSRSCVTDMTLSTFLSFTLGLLLLMWLKLGPPRVLFWLAVLAFGLAVLTKATPVLCVVAVLIIERTLSLPGTERARFAKPLGIFFGLAIAFSIAAVACSMYELDPAEQERYQARIENGKTSDAVNAERLKLGERMHLADQVLNSASWFFASGAILCILWLAWKSRRTDAPLKGSPWPVGLVLTLLMGAWWYFALVQRFGWDEFQRLLEFEITERLAGNVHREGMQYYITNLIALVLPWAPALPGAILLAWPDEKRASDATTVQRADRFLLAWLLGVTLFFSIPGAKLATYILPAFPAVALLLARFIARWSSAREPVSGGLKKLTTVLVIVLCAVLIAGGFIPVSYPDDFARFLKALAVPIGVLGAVYGVALALASWQMARRPLTGGFCVMAASFAIIAATAHAAFPVFLQGRSARGLCEASRAKLDQCERFISLGSDRESLSFYADRTIRETRRRKVEENEPLEAVVREELQHPQRTALFMHRKYYARMVGLNAKNLPRENEPLQKLVPEYAEFVGANEQMVLLMPRR